MTTDSPFAKALQKSGLRSVDFCRAVEKLTGQPCSAVLASRWRQGKNRAPVHALALVALLGQLPNEELQRLIKNPQALSKA